MRETTSTILRRSLQIRQSPLVLKAAQCYIPPLPYILPAIILATGRINLWQAAKFAQLINILLSLGLTYYLLKICDLIDPKNILLKISSLVMLGILPVYYKTYSLIRGETYLPLLIVFIAYQFLSLFSCQRPCLNPTWFCLGWQWVWRSLHVNGDFWCSRQFSWLRSMPRSKIAQKSGWRFQQWSFACSRPSWLPVGTTTLCFSGMAR